MNRLIFTFLAFLSSVVSVNAGDETYVKGARLDDYMRLQSKNSPHARYYYGEDKGNNFLDLYVPAEIDEKKSAVVVIHGGCWDSEYEGFAQAGDVVDYFLGKGYVVFNLEYTAADIGGGYPKTYDDVSNALLKVSSVLEDKKLSNSGISLIGHSAGGHLAVWAASGGTESHTEEYLEKVKIKQAVGLGAILDLGLAEEACPNIARFGGVGRIAGANMALTSPILMGNNSPVKLVNGSKDSIAPPKYAEAYSRKRNSGSVSYRVVPDATHYDLMTSKSGVLDIVLDMMRSK
ncbi:alpha/beta hydrolase [Pseudomonas sp. Q1-7]|uniref:alpha/beta hydrolase n=1 Tax=Pseudomonas sp. Q1-7 TaxID=3020843 RepID=UPI0023017BDF|nr:alpha/beta hydrolase [Pseudomonas sp. Q1-7]